jgi:hypothetical protein
MAVKIVAWSLFFLVLLAFKLWNDYKAKNEQKRIINHAQSAIIDGAWYFVISAVFFGLCFWKWMLLAISLRWILFDLIFNLLNGWRWNFCGNSSKIDFTLDNLDGIDDNICKLGILLKTVLLAVSILILLL